MSGVLPVSEKLTIWQSGSVFQCFRLSVLRPNPSMAGGHGVVIAPGRRSFAAGDGPSEEIGEAWDRSRATFDANGMM